VGVRFLHDTAVDTLLAASSIEWDAAGQGGAAVVAAKQGVFVGPAEPVPLGPPVRHRCMLPPMPDPRSPCSNTYPAALWEKIEEKFPNRRRTHPVCVDIAIGAEGRGGVELARRWAGQRRC